VRQWSPKLAPSPHLFEVQPTIRWRYHGENYSPEDRIPGDNPPKGALINYYLEKKPKDDLTLEILDAKGALVQKLSSKKQDPEAAEDAPDVPWSIFKPTVLPAEPGINRTNWDLTQAGPKIIPGAKNDAGVPYRGPLVVPGTYTLKLTVDGRTLDGKVVVLPDPRAKVPAEDLLARHAFAMQLREDISLLGGIVVNLQAVRKQLKERVKLWMDLPKTKEIVDGGKALIFKLDTLEDKLHNPRAEVTYDILAIKGGAKLYSQLAPLYASANDSDGPVTQGMREVYADLTKELQRLAGEWTACRADLARINRLAAEAGIANILVPVQKQEMK
jgi:hypothetical protein